MDRYGNRTIDYNNTSASMPRPSFGVDTSTNRLTAPSGSTVSYDAAGNLTNDTYTGQGQRTYDAENHMTSAGSAGILPASYSYDASGQRVRRTVNGVETWAVYGLGGALLAEYAANAAATAPQKEYGYRNGQLLVTAARVNVASSASGATATAQNYPQDGVYPGLHFQPAYAIDGVHYIHGPDGDQFWRDEHGLPSWLQVDLNGSKTIDEIDVYTLSDYPAYFSEPTATTTFSQQGLSAFNVQYWNGSAWVTVTGGTITGNNLAWRKINFAAVTTSKIRVVANAASDSVARIAEVEAFATDVRWLVTDQLGTPRLIFDKTGALATTSRHDYNRSSPLSKSDVPFAPSLISLCLTRTPGR